MQVRFEESVDGVSGVYDRYLHYQPEIVDLRGNADPRGISVLAMREDYSRPVDPRVDRTARGILFQLADEHFLLYNRVHHLITDGYGGKERMSEALRAYSAGVAGEPLPEIEPVDLDLPARADAEYRASRRYGTDRAYWREVMEGVGLPRSLARRVARPEAVARRVAEPVPDRTMALLRQVAEQHSAIPPAVIVAACSAYMARVASGDEVIFQFPVAARTTAALRRTPLPVSNVVPLRTGVTSEKTVADALVSVRTALMGALRHQRFRGEEIWADVAADEESGRTPRTDAQLRSGPMLNLMLFERQIQCGEAIATYHVLSTGPVEDIAINIYNQAGDGDPDGLMLCLDANPNRYDEAEVAEHHRQFMAMLDTFAQAVLDAPETLVDDLPLVVDEPRVVDPVAVDETASSESVDESLQTKRWFRRRKRKNESEGGPHGADSLSLTCGVSGTRVEMPATAVEIIIASMAEAFEDVADGGTLAIDVVPELGRVLSTAYGVRVVADRAEATHWITTPTRLANAASETLPHTVITLGERLSPALAAHVARDHRLYDLGGHPELLGATNASRVDADIPLDRPLPWGATTTACTPVVLDHRLRPVPPGITGELYVIGAPVLGYADESGITTGSFVDCPWSPAHRMWRTGDRGHLEAGTGTVVVDHRPGEIVFPQGIRVDTAELARTAAPTDGVVDVVIVDRGDELAVGIVAQRDADRSRVRAAVRRRVNGALPQVLWPRHVAVLDTLPVDDAGTLDRPAVAERIAATPEPAAPYRAPATDTERLVADAVTDILGVTNPSMDDELVKLGATSLAFMQLAVQLGPALGVVVSMRDLVDVTTLGELATAIDAATPRRTSADGQPEYRPTRTQHEIWLLNRADPHAIVYHLPLHLTVAAGVEVSAVRAALIDVAIRHEALRTIHPDVDGEPVARIRDTDGLRATAPISEGILDVAGTERAVAAPFDLTVDLPWRAVIDTSGDTVELVLVAHHIAIDEWSVPIVLGDFTIALDARTAGRAPEWADEPIGFGATLEARASSDTGASGLYWMRALRGAPERLSLPEPAQRTENGLTYGPATYLTRHIDPEVRRRAEARAQQAGTTLNTLLSVALAQTLSVFCDTDDVVFGMPVADRRSSDELQQVGMYVQTVPVRVTGVREMDVDTALRRVGGVVGKAVQRAATAPSGLPDVVFAYHGVDVAPPSGGAGAVRAFEGLRTYHARVPLELVVDDGESPLVTLVVAGGVVDAAAGRAMVEYFVSCVGGLGLSCGLGASGDGGFDTVSASASSGSTINGCASGGGGFDTVSASASTGSTINSCASSGSTINSCASGDGGFDTVSASASSGSTINGCASGASTVNGGASTIDSGASTVNGGVGVVAAIRSHPVGAAAVVGDGEHLTYGELVGRADEFAARLRAGGVRDGDRVALIMGRSADTIVAILGTLIAGAAYVPIDPDHPTTRIEHLLAATQPAAIVRDGLQITDGPGLGTAERMPGAAYIIHTSGSTGVPKGVVVTLDNLAALLDAELGRLGARADDVWTWAHNHIFDFSVWEIFGALTSGGSVLVLSTEVLRDPRRLAATLDRHGATLLSQTPTAFAALTDPAVVGAAALSTLRVVTLGGEALAPATLRHWAATHPDCRLVNLYGPTETTVGLTTAEVDLTDERSVIGTPLDHVEWAVLDARLCPVPMGAIGELYVSGAHVSHGYLNAPALTAARFVAGPDGTRRYRTGDRVREIAPGVLAYLGRSDDQIQLRGHRIELGEVAAALRGVDGVGDVRVLVQPGARPGDERLVAFATADGFAERDALDGLTEPALLAACATRLPAHAVPARIGVVEGWPVTPTGKVDKTALLAQLTHTETTHTETARALTDDEQSIADAVREIVGEMAGELTPHTNFFAAGGTSLSAARLAAALNRDGHAVGVADIFADATIEGLARLIGTTPEQPLPALAEHRVEPDRLPLTPEQLDLWLRWRAEPDFTGYLLPIALPTTADATTLGAALREVLGRHDALHTSYPSHDGVPYQQRWGTEELDTFIATHCTVTRVHDEAELGAVFTEVATPLDLAAALPWRIRIVEITDAGTGPRAWILGVVHHIAADGETLALLRADLQAALAGTLPPAPPVGYRQYSLWRAATLAARHDELLAHWTAAFAEPVTSLRLPDMNLQAVGGAATTVHRARHTLDAELTATLDRLAVDHHTSGFIVVHTALAAVLARQSGAGVITVGTAVSGRIDPLLAELPGLFARGVPLHTPIDLDATFGALLREITGIDVGAFAHADLPLTEITALADPGRARAGTPLFEVSLGAVPDDLFANDAGPGGLSADDLAALAVPLYGVDVSVHRSGGALHLTMTCRDTVATAARLDALCAAVVELLSRGVAQPDRVVGELLTGTESVVPEAAAPDMLAALLESGLRTAPDALAVVDTRHPVPGYGPQLTNAQLDAASAGLARLLIARGIGPGDVVVQHLRRSAVAVVTSLAVARTGAAFVNVDPTDPDDRRRMIITRARPAAVLTLDAATVPADAPVIVVDETVWASSEMPFDARERVRPLTADDLAYLTFTSGTTGTPKGVQVTQRGLAGFARSTVERLGLQADDRVLHTYAPGFDAQLMGLLPVRVAGATIVVCPPEVIAGDDLTHLITDTAVSMLFTTPSVLATLDPAEVPGVRHVAVGGEPLGAGLVRDWTQGRSITNEYGPTETTVAVTSIRFDTAETGADGIGGIGIGGIGIGAALPGIGLHVLDAALRPVGDHTIGELYVSGPAVARGYLDDPARTATTFVAGPDGRRRYRTGDLVHRRTDGTLVIHGRSDDQVKVRGIRLEPAEIDAAVSAQDGVATSVTAVRANGGGEKVLVSWLVPDPGHTVDLTAVRTGLAQVLPRSIIPTHLVVVDELPVGLNGKVDMTRLPEPVADGAASELVGAAQELVAAVWAEVLDVEPAGIGSGTDFFGIGGTSLSATQVTSRLSAATGIDVGVRVLFEARTVAGVAARLTVSGGADDEAASDGVDLIVHREIDGPVPLAYPQQRMWIHHRYDPDSTAYHVPLVLRLGDAVDAERLTTAVDALVARHAVLRTVYPDVSGEPMQRVLAAGPQMAVREVATADVDDAIEEFLAAPFDLAVEPGFRVALFVVRDGDGETDRVLAASLHHIAVDGWSMRLLFEDLLRGYATGSIEATTALTYADFTLWQAQRLGDPADPDSRYAREIGYWRAVLDGVGEPVRLPGLLEMSGPAAGRAGRIVEHLDADVASKLAERADELSASMFHVAHAALVSVIGGWTGRRDVVVGVPVHGRSAPEWESVAGMFVNTVAIRTVVADDAPFDDVVGVVREAALGAAAHAEVPYEAVARAVRPDAAGGDPLISVLLVNQDVVPEVSAGVGELVSVVDSAVDVVDAKYDIEVVLSASGGSPAGLDVRVVHSGRVPAVVASRFLRVFVEVLERVASGDVGVRRAFGALGALGASGGGGFDTASAGASTGSTINDCASDGSSSNDSALGASGGGGFDTVSAGASTGSTINDSASTGSTIKNYASGGNDSASGGATSRGCASGGNGDELVAAIMAEVLGVDAVGADDDFFSIGGSSLSATRVTSALGRELGVRVPTRLLFENPSPALLAVAVDGLAAEPEISTPVVAAGVDLPLAPTQRRMWVTAQMLGPLSIYAVPVVVPVPDGVDDQRVAAAIAHVVDRHPALRTHYPSSADGPRQRVIPGWLPELRRVAIAHFGAGTTDPEALLSVFGRPFDLEAEPPVRAWILVDGTSSAVVIVAHHIAFDGESAAVVATELGILLNGGDLGPAPLGFDAVSARMIDEQARTHTADLAFWRQTLDGYSGRLDLVPHRPAARDLLTASVDIALGGDRSQRIGETSQTLRATDFHVLHAALALALGAQAGVDDVAVATPASMRRDTDAADVVGMLVSTVVLRNRIPGRVSIGDWVTAVRDADLAAFDHALTAFDDVVAAVDPVREPGRHPLVQVAFSSITAGPDTVTPGAFDDVIAARSEFDLHVIAVDDRGRRRLRLEYARDLFDENMIDALGARILAAVDAVVGDTGRTLASLDLLGDDERATVRAHATATDADRPLLLADLLADAVARYPRRVAVDDGERVLTYRGLDDWVSVTARALRDKGFGAGDAVAVGVARSIESVVAIWAISRIGAVCVPLDVSYPASRLAQIVSASGARVIHADDIPRRPVDRVVPEPITRVSPDALAYIITTSGTTGAPNPVGVSHRGVHRIAGLGDVRDRDRVGMTISPGFDATFHDMLLPLATGATLAVVPAQIIGGPELTAWLRDQRVSVFTATPSVIRTLDPAAITSLRLVYMGGEALTTDLADLWSPYAQVIDIYGPTETTVTVSTGHYRPGDPVRIGRPVPGVGCIVLDPWLRPVPPGVVGELYVSGSGVARGYLGDPALTATHFVAGPDGRRMYRTGDLVRWESVAGARSTETGARSTESSARSTGSGARSTETGARSTEASARSTEASARSTGVGEPAMELVYVGRADRQIKIRGQRVEPAEIDAVLTGAGATGSATVLRDGPAGPALVSYVTAPTVSTVALRAACRAGLPRHMVPAQIVVVDELPRTGAGKLDERSLPEPQWAQSRRAPAPGPETELVASFEAVLEVPVGVDDDFFAAGGNSLAMLLLRDEITRRTGVQLSATDLFARPTPAELAALIVDPTRMSNDRVVELSGPATESDDAPIVWCVHTAAGIVEPFRPLADAMEHTRVLGLQLPELVDPTLDLPATLPELAARHVAALRSAQPSGPYRLVGWSLGGLIAHEVARQLVDAGEQVTHLALLDARTPAELQSAPDDELHGESPLRQAALQCDPDAVRRFDERSEALAAAARGYALVTAGVGKVLYLAAAENPDPDAWAREVGDGVEVVRVDARHAELGDPGVLKTLARLLEEEQL
ncbi:non-ribosomal peptide synthetase [Gordonia sp. NB41Y]|uniref:non-ribosomal peptide synthetase n=1 Tax=Gordonia sp. NB41Y TaxID=875808 RepID=UPI00128ECB18|nr:non-ribosomal peptide synthetase [Gordonia sp. NB41Y]WLP92120.1 non-ribosomal peptide synthetase [Gordonia sp. NB41Y]